MKKRTVLLSLVSFVAPLFLGCSGAEAPTTTPPPAAAAAMSADVSARVEASLADYASLQGALAADRLADVAGIAARLAASANAAREGAPTPVSGRLGEMATAAASLQAGGSDDDQRRAFGEISRAVVSLLSENAALTKGRKVYQCPMAQGYKKWVQKGDQIENPYMGARMLRCGSASEWRP